MNAQRFHPPPHEYDYLVKLVCVGDSGVGKSAMVRRFADDEFDRTGSFVATIGVDFRIVNMDIDGKRIKVQLWDTAGQERFRAITSAYYRGADGIVLANDTTARDSLANTSQWLQDVQRYAKDSVPVLVCGTKSDLKNEREVGDGAAVEERVQQRLPEGVLAHRVHFAETSSKTGAGVEQTLATIIALALEEKRARELAFEPQALRLPAVGLGLPLVGKLSSCGC